MGAEDTNTLAAVEFEVYGQVQGMILNIPMCYLSI